MPQPTGVVLPNSSQPSSEAVAVIEAAIAATQHDLISGMREHHPDFGPVLSELMASPKVGFGEATALVMIAGGDAGDPAAGILRGVAAVLEMVNLIAVLHAELPLDLRSVDSAASWGWETLSVCLADCINAEALRLINELPPSIAEDLALELRRVMRRAVLAASAEPGGEDLVSTCRGEVLTAAVIIAGDLAASTAQASTARASATQPSADLPPLGA